MIPTFIPHVRSRNYQNHEKLDCDYYSFVLFSVLVF